MGTKVEAWYDGSGSPSGLEEWFEQAERAFSRFRPDSELSRLNDLQSDELELSQMMLGVLEHAAWARIASDGLVDVGVGSAVEAWGYDRTFSEVVDLEGSPDQSTLPTWELEGGRLHRRPGTRLDLGGIAKGWTVDRAVEMGLASVVSAGGDLRSAHSETLAAIEDPWGDTVARVHVGERAMATSSIAKRQWRVGGKQVSHLLDPRSMRPVETPIVSATVLARTTVLAEVGAKAVLLNGIGGLAWGAAQPWIDAALVIWHDGSVFATQDMEIAA